jgi:hypothetical protein
MVSWKVLTGSIFPLWDAIKNSFTSNKGFAVRIMKVSLPRAATAATSTTNETKESSSHQISSGDDQEIIIGLWIPNGKIEQVVV